MGKVFRVGRTHKRIYAFMLAAVMVFCLCACGKSDTGTEAGKNNGGSAGKETVQGNNGGNDATGSGNGNGSNGGNAAQGQQETGGFKVVIHSTTKADFIIEDAYIEPDSKNRIEIVFGKEDEYYNMKKYSYEDCYLGRATREEREGFGYEITSSYRVGDYTYEYDGDRLTISVDMAKCNIPFNFYEAEQYEISRTYFPEGSGDGHTKKDVFVVADAAAGDDSWLVDMGDGGAPLQIAANFRVEPYNSKLVYFIIDSFDVEPGSKDIYQVVFDLKGDTYCMQARENGEGYIDVAFCTAAGGDKDNFESIDACDIITDTYDGGLQVSVRLNNTDIDMDYDSIGEYTLRYFANEGYDGCTEKTYEAADVVSVPLDCLAYEDDGNGGVKITDFNILSNHKYYAGTREEMEYTYIPRAIGGKPVTTIERCPACGYVIVPDSVTRICAGAFRGEDITGITIPATATDVVIGENDFVLKENLKSLVIRGGNAIIEESSFELCGLTYIDIDVKSIGNSAFASCKSIESLNVVAETIGEGAFMECDIKRAVILADVIGKAAFGSYGEGRIDELILREGIREIGEEAFVTNEYLTSVTIPGSVEKIGRAAFQSCMNLTDVVICEGAKEIGEIAFASCSKLERLSLPSTLTAIGESAFSGCEGLMSVTIPGSVKTVERWAFNNCRNLTDVVICEGVEVLEVLSFGACGDLHVSLPDSLRKLGVNSLGETVFHYSDDLVATYKGATYTTASYSGLYAAVNGK